MSLSINDSIVLKYFAAKKLNKPLPHVNVSMVHNQTSDPPSTWRGPD